jgi:3-isopropylmalate/(R)-2-methylmalate dehydratase small subunit
MYAMAGVPEGQIGLPDGNIRFVDEGKYTSEYTVVIGGKNFGCGSSREHAPLAIAEAGGKIVIAEFYARIFFRNCVNGGYLVPLETNQRLVDKIATGDEVEVDVDNGKLTHVATGVVYDLNPLGDVKPIIDAGGVFEYAKQAGMLG